MSVDGRGRAPGRCGTRGQAAWRRAAMEVVERRQLLTVTGATTLPNITQNLHVLITQSPYNAVADGTTDNATAIQNAINAVNTAGGGTVEVPAESKPFEFSTFELKSNVELLVDSGAELQATSKDSASNGIITNASGATNFEVIGEGTGSSQGDIDGNGASWYPSTSGPDFFKLNSVTNVLFQNVTISNSPHEHLVIEGSATSNVTINGITIQAPPEATAKNTDGIDFGGSNSTIENSTINDGDDDIVLKPESVACNNILIQGDTIGYGHGISIGGQTNDGVNGLLVNDCTFNGTSYGIHLKAGVGTGGLVQNLTYSNITMTNVPNAIFIDSYYNGSDNFPSNPTTDKTTTVANLTPEWKNITFENFVSVSNTGFVGEIGGLPEEPIQGMSFINCQFTAPDGLSIDHVRNVSFDSATTITTTSSGQADLNGSPSFAAPTDDQITEAPFVNVDIGAPTVVFDTSESIYDPRAATYAINGDGANITGTSDQFNYTYQPVTGSSSIDAQLTALTSPGSPAVPQAGVMYRASTAVGDAFAAVVQTTGNQIVFEWRATSGGTMQVSSPVSATVGSYYLEVVRSGSNFSGFYSTNGTNWTQVGSTESISAIPSTANAGLAVTADSNGKEAPATFGHVALTLTVASGPTVVNPAAGTVAGNGKSVSLSALGSDAAGASSLTYTWTATSVPNGVTTPTFDANNGTNAGQNETATLFGTGAYTFLVTITDPSNLSITSSTLVTVNQVLSGIMVSPATLSLPVKSTYQFSAGGQDQFSNAMSLGAVTWSASGTNNSISSTGLLTLNNPHGNCRVTASSGGVSGSAVVTPLAAGQTPPVVSPVQVPPGPAGGGGTVVSAPAAPVAAAPVVVTPTIVTPIAVTPTVAPAAPALVVTPPQTITNASNTTAADDWWAAANAQSSHHGLIGLAALAWHGAGWGW